MTLPFSDFCLILFLYDFALLGFFCFVFCLILLFCVGGFEENRLFVVVCRAAVTPCRVVTSDFFFGVNLCLCVFCRHWIWSYGINNGYNGSYNSRRCRTRRIFLEKKSSFSFQSSARLRFKVLTVSVSVILYYHLQGFHIHHPLQFPSDWTVLCDLRLQRSWAETEAALWWPQVCSWAAPSACHASLGMCILLFFTVITPHMNLALNKWRKTTFASLVQM